MGSWVEKQRHFIDFTLSSLLRRKWKNGALLLVYGLVVFVIASVIFFAQSIRKEAENLLEDAPEMIVQRTVGGRHDLIPVSYAGKIREIRGVQSVKPRLWGYYYHPAARSNYTIMVPNDFSHGNDEIKVGQGVLRTWGTADGDRLYFKAYNGEAIILKVVETFTGATELVSSDLILASESTFRRISGVPQGFATDLEVRIRNEKEYQTIAEKIVQVLPDTRPLLREEIQRTYASLFDWRGGYVIVLLSGAVFAFFIFAWDKATGLSAEEKNEVGILKGLGWDTSDILLMKFWEGALISLTAFVLGTTAAYIHVFLASAPLFEHALKGWAVLYPEFKLHPSINAYQLGVLFSLTVLPYTLITIVPTWKISVTDPDKVMRGG
jgi:ABC-type lipoprotein release transport system permease subunit